MNGKANPKIGNRVAWHDALTKLVVHGIIADSDYICKDGTVLVQAMWLTSPEDEQPDPKRTTLIRKDRLIDPEENPQTYDFRAIYGCSADDAERRYEDDKRMQRTKEIRRKMRYRK